MATSSVSGVNKVGNNYYRTKVTDQGDGTFTSTLFRTDAKGKNEVPISGYATPKGGGSAVQSINTSNATAEEKKLLANPNSQLNQTRKNQVKSTESDFFGNAGGSSSQKSQLDKAGGGSGNAAKTTEDNKASVDISNQLQTVSGTNAGLPGSGSSPLIYPIDMNPKQDHVTFTQLEYSPRALSDTSQEQNNPLKLGQRASNRKRLGTVVLPIQTGIMDSNGATWGEDSMNALDLAKINIMKSAITGGFKEAADTAGTAAEQGSKDFSTQKGSIANLITQAMTGKNVLARADGSIVNENQELLFQGPTLRSFSFTFKLSAREAAEAKTIANIIRFFKQGMAPQRTSSSYFLKSPNTFLIEYKHNDQDHPGVHKIKECALKVCSVNYTPDGYYAAHSDGYLVTYDITMEFQELEPVFNDEYASLNNQIGY